VAGLIGLLVLIIGAGGGTYGQLTVPAGVAEALSALLPFLAACIGFVFATKNLSLRCR
jgi:drug/metabolite transporter (DMT)-like permease